MDKHFSLKKIARDLFDICYDTSKNIRGLSMIDAKLRAKSNSLRHAHTIRAMIKHVDIIKRNNLNVLNASGLESGNLDFSILNFFKDNTNISISWTSLESPDSEFLSNSLFNDYISKLSIKLILHDHSRSTNLLEQIRNKYDIIIFTEIAEHLDHSVLLNTLLALKEKLNNQGIIIITAPNLVYFPNRIRILFGNGDFLYHNDGLENLKKGIFGHITSFDLSRLTRILCDLGYKIESSYTFNWGLGQNEKYITWKILFYINNILYYFFKKSGQNLFIVAKKDRRQLD